LRNFAPWCLSLATSSHSSIAHILLNLFELEQLTVADVMTPRGEIEAIDIAAPIEDIKQQLATSFHTRVAVFENDPANIIGILHQRRLLADAFGDQLDHVALRNRMSEPYFIPAATPIYTQLQFFRENRQRLGMVVDEYGEIDGLVTLEDIIEELVGKFTTRQSDVGGAIAWNESGTVLVDGAVALRELNRLLDLDFALDGPTYPEWTHSGASGRYSRSRSWAANRYRSHRDRANTGPKNQDGTASPARRRVILSA
jgi:Mg2+/Co2+ transporter CorB